MPRLDQFLIAPLTEGFRTDIRPWLLPEEAFAKLQNAYVWRGRLRKRFGSKYLVGSIGVTAGFEQLNSRLRINIGTTDAGTGNFATNVPGIVWEVGQAFSIEGEMFTVEEAGVAKTMLTTGSTVATYDTTTGAVSFTAAAKNKAVYFYPATPVMGFVNYEDPAINKEPTYAFDTQFAYRYISGGWERLGTVAWTGTNSNFFWGENFRGSKMSDTVLFVTNNTTTDNIRYWDGATWTVFTPQYTTTATDTIEGCRLIISFKDRLLFLNTYESIGGAAAVNYPNRVRYSVNGSPLVAATSWLEAPQTPGKGGWIDAPTKEAIVSAKILRDRLVVFFERSTWELVYTGNKVIPFVFQRINSELGAESTFSTVLFDKVLLGVGNVGIHACSGSSVERIDQKIPDEVFEFHNGNEGIERIFGIRDYTTEMVYWTLPDADENPIYPTRVLAYNYKNQTWSINDDSITALGYIQNLNDITWADVTWTWDEWLDSWGSGGNQSEHRKVIAGNQEGYTFLIEAGTPRNVGGLQITQIEVPVSGDLTITAINHNLQVGDFVLIENVNGTGGVDGIFQVQTIVSVNEFTITAPDYDSVAYTGGGTVARVSRIDIETKEYNFYQKQGLNVFIPKIGFYVDRTANGQISVDYSTSSSSLGLTEQGTASGALLGTNILETHPYVDSLGNLIEPYEATQDRFWHFMYPNAEGEVIQMHIYLNDTQMLDYQIALSDFNLNAMSIFSKPVHRA